jgi:hypothetical protein
MSSTALRRDEADLEKNKASGIYQGTEIAFAQFVKHVIAIKEFSAVRELNVTRSLDALAEAPIAES